MTILNRKVFVAKSVGVDMATTVYTEVEIPAALRLTVIPDMMYPTLYATGYWNDKPFKIGAVYSNALATEDLHFVAKKLAYMVAENFDLNGIQFLEINKAFAAIVKYDTVNTAEVFNNPVAATESSSAEKEIEKKSKELPGMNRMVEVQCNCYSSSEAPLWNHIQHLNDDHSKWTRERIADWLQELHDSGKINLEFEPWRTEQEILDDED